MTRVCPAALSLILVACAGGGTGSGGGSGSGGGGGGGSGGAGGSGACNTVVNGGTTVSKMSNAGAAPTMTGGTLMDGTYFLTAMDRYNGTTGSSTHKETWVFSGNTVQIATLKSTDSGEKHFNATYSISGTAVTLVVNCPTMMSLTSPFTATGTTLKVINADDAQEMHTFVRQ